MEPIVWDYAHLTSNGSLNVARSLTPQILAPSKSKRSLVSDAGETNPFETVPARSNR